MRTLLLYYKGIDRGVLYMLFASISFAIMGGFAKLLTSSLPAIEVTFFRNIFGVVIIVFAIYKSPLKQIGGRPFLLLFRGVMGFFALASYFYLMGNIPLGEAITYNKTSPLFVALFAWIFLKERINKSAIFALIVGFLGIVLIAKPVGGVFDIYDILGIFSGIGAALAYTSIRELRKYYDTRAIVLSFMGVGTIGPILFLTIGSFYTPPQSFSWLISKFVMPSGIEWVYIVFVGLFATISQLLMTKAYELTKAGIVGAVSYTNIVFGIFIGVALGDSWPDILTTAGMILVILAGVVVAFSKDR